MSAEHEHATQTTGRAPEVASAGLFGVFDPLGNYIGKQPDYGCDANNEPVQPGCGWRLVPWGSVILSGDQAFDIYAGWMKTDGWHARNQCHAESSGRWTAWRRRTPNTQVSNSGPEAHK